MSSGDVRGELGEEDYADCLCHLSESEARASAGLRMGGSVQGVRRS